MPDIDASMQGVHWFRTSKERFEAPTSAASADHDLVVIGAGYAGLTSFATLAPDVVKFDMELVRDISESDTRSKLVASMVAVCRELGILSLAEGVETDSELHHLEELGCDLFQGYRIAKPDAAFWLPTD